MIVSSAAVMPEIVLMPVAGMTQHSRTVDDARIDYASTMGMEEARSRYSEDVVDKDLKDNIRLRKMYRQVQRQTRSSEEGKVGTTAHNPALTIVYQGELAMTWKIPKDKEVLLIQNKTKCLSSSKTKSSDMEKKRKHVEFVPDTKAIRANSLAASTTSKNSISQKLKAIEEEYERKRLYHRRRSTVMVTSGALTIILLAATLVTATFLMSPVIEKAFGK